MGSRKTMVGSKNIRTSEAAPVKSGDRQPEQQTLVVPQRQCLRLVVYLPVQWPLPPTRGTTACPCIVAHITKTATNPGRPATPLSDGPPRLGPRRAWPPAAPSGDRQGFGTVLSLLRGARACSATPIAATRPSADPSPVLV